MHMVPFVMCIGEDKEDSYKSYFFGYGFGKVYNVATTSATQCVRETGVSIISVRRILKAVECNLYIPRSLHAINDDDTDRQMQFSEWFQ